VLVQLLFPILMLVLLWVLMIRPQQKRLREHQALLATLEVGDEVVTAGGVYGTITWLDATTVDLEVADGVVIKVMRSSVNGRVYEDEDDELAADDGAGSERDGGEAR
jgi:preprotein translocase subunit YajC